MDPIFSVQILGSSAALPAYDRHPSAQLLIANNHYYLIDCGEGTQMQFRKYGLKMQRVKVVFISHLHGDHYFGLIGLLNSMHLLGRQAELKIVCPSGLQKILELQMDSAKGRLQFPISYIFTDEVKDKTKAQLIYSDNHLKVEAFPLKHKIPCWGYLFRETQRPRNFLAEKMEELKIPVSAIPGIKNGDDFTTDSGMVIPNEELTLPAPVPRSYAYCTDTLPLDHLKNFVEQANVMYHEATFLEEGSARARTTFHSTAGQAAQVALSSHVQRLLIGHFSARYRTLDDHLTEAKSIFPNVELAEEGRVFEID